MHGFIAIMSALRHTKRVRAVCEMTFAYAHGNKFMQAPNFWQTISTADLAKRDISSIFMMIDMIQMSCLNQKVKANGSRRYG